MEYWNHLILLASFIGVFEIAGAFVVPARSSHMHKVQRLKSLSMSKNQDESASNESNPIASFFDMFSNFDDVVDDFFYKRMGKGEIFYGKRKYKPSGDVEGNYNGFGLSDKGKIDYVREMKEEYEAERAWRAELAKIQKEREGR